MVPAAPGTPTTCSTPHTPDSVEVPRADVAAEIVRRALATLAPTTAPARRHPGIVITRHTDVTPRTASGVTVPTPPKVCDCVSPVGSGSIPAHGARATAATELLGHRPECGVGLLVLDTTGTGGAPVDLHGVIGDPAAVLVPGGVLAVITASDHRAGRLRDPRPALIASARAAGLDYWQHIVTTHADNRDHDRDEHSDGRRSQHREHDGHNERGGWGSGRRPEWRLVAEVSVFRRPSDAGRLQQPADAGDLDGPGEAQEHTTTEVQP